MNNFYIHTNKVEKAYDRVPREVVYWCLRRKGVPEQMVRMVQATYKEVTTRVQTDYGETEEFGIEVGLHQGSALSPFLFVTIMDTLTEEVRSDIPWELIFADDIALLAESEKELQKKVQRWQTSLIKGGLKMNTEKSETLVSEREGDTKIKVKDVNGVLLQLFELLYFLVCM